jgi:hypothetical protein
MTTQAASPEASLQVSYDLTLTWVLRRWQSLVPIVIGTTAFGIIERVGPNVMSFGWLAMTQGPLTFVFALQATVVFIMLVLTLDRVAGRLIMPKPSSSAVEQRNVRGAKSCGRFWWYWRGVLATWLLFYFAKAMQYTHGVTHPTDPFSWFISQPWLQWLKADAVLDAINLLEAIFLFGVYVEMVEVTVLRRSNSSHPEARSLPWGLMPGATIVVGLVAVLRFVDPGRANWWTIAGALLVGISMALFVGRFESRFIGAPLLVTPFLFLYAILQTVYPLFPHGEHASIDVQEFLGVVIIVALALKILMFVVVDWLWSGGKLLFYMVHERELMEGPKQVNKEWSRFWHIALQDSVD